MANLAFDAQIQGDSRGNIRLRMFQNKSFVPFIRRSQVKAVGKVGITAREGGHRSASERCGLQVFDDARHSMKIVIRHI